MNDGNVMNKLCANISLEQAATILAIPRNAEQTKIKNKKHEAIPVKAALFVIGFWILYLKPALS